MHKLFKKLITGISLTVGLLIQPGFSMEDSARAAAETFNPITQRLGVSNIIMNYVDIRSMEALACCSEGLKAACNPKIQAIHLRLSQGFNWSQGYYLSAAEEGHNLNLAEAEEEYLSFKNLHYSCVSVLPEPRLERFYDSAGRWSKPRNLNTEGLFTDRDGFFDFDTFLRYSGFRHAEHTAEHTISFFHLDWRDNALEALLQARSFYGPPNRRCFYQTKWFQPDSVWIQKITKAKFTPQEMRGKELLIWSELPICISQLRNLQDLKVSHISWIHPWVGNLGLLQRFTLVNSYVSEIPESFGNLYSLRVLDLSNNRLRNLPDIFGGLHSLEEIYLQKNRLRNLPESIENLPLKTLDLSDNLFEEAPSILKQPSGRLMRSLEKLNLAGNPFLGSDIQGLMGIEFCSWSFDDQGLYRVNNKLDKASSLIALRALANKLFE
jgi:hypothetical protein